MRISLRYELKNAYSKIVFGSLVVRSVPNKKRCEKLEQQKRQLKRRIKREYIDVARDSMIQSYADYFKRWEKTYSIEF